MPLPGLANPLVRARRDGRLVATTSLDLGLPRVEVVVTPDAALLPGVERLGWTAVERVTAVAPVCGALIALIALAFFVASPLGRASTDPPGPPSPACGR